MAQNKVPLKYAKGVFPAPEDEMDPDFFEALAKPGKRRITTMVDEDVYQMLKMAAKTEGDGRYQTYLNQLLRKILLGSMVRAPESDFEWHRTMERLREDMVDLQSRFDKIDKSVSEKFEKKLPKKATTSTKRGKKAAGK